MPTNDTANVVSVTDDGTTTIRFPDADAHELRDFLASHAPADLPHRVWHLLRLLSYAHGEAF